MFLSGERCPGSWAVHPARARPMPPDAARNGKASGHIAVAVVDDGLVGRTATPVCRDRIPGSSARSLPRFGGAAGGGSAGARALDSHTYWRGQPQSTVLTGSAASARTITRSTDRPHPDARQRKPRLLAGVLSQCDRQSTGAGPGAKTAAGPGRR